MNVTLDPPAQRRLEARARREGKATEALAADLLAASLRPETSEEREAELLARITEGLPEGFWIRKKALDDKADAFVLTPTEYDERLALQHRLERWFLERMECVLELAQLRGETPAAVMQRLGISE